ncbi:MULTISPECIES: M13 family metallopeptidase [unclassified Flavobacterium]|uniref:M13 family metallopeptidase n=1 Tax=unclassified Flavobacterium TaxID=196869 RepID=UPI00070A2564|nr:MULTISPECIES: M13 family metallopeptidase [unclassified Flavobacterium]KRD62819.1 endothelin-converting protein [Flavobacterium sp. Root935]MDQ1168022.1 putative endopeptidase [Flavobacterium sp. SORGH_AS_0622]BDU24089.1 endothelin-converting protein [Flavobacterium sp. GSB-24]
MKKQFAKPVFGVISAMFSLTAVQAQDAASKEPGINVSYMDTKVSPSQDFFKYVNGTWLQKTEIPSDRTTWGSFNELIKRTDKDVMTVLKDASKNPKYKSNTDQGKAVNLFNTVLDSVGRNKRGIEPLKPYLKKIDAIKNVADVQKYLVEMEKEGGSGFFGIYIGADDKNSSKNSVNLSPSQLGLPDKDYYTSDDKDSKEKRAKYELHVARMLQFIGESPEKAKQSAAEILALETELSQPRLNRVERRDSRLQYNPMTIADIQKLTPAIKWNEYFTGLGITKLDTVIVSEPKYMTALQTVFKENKVGQWKEYLKWDLLNSAASQLSSDIDNANFDFYSKTLRGAIKQLPAEERALAVVNRSVGEALGKLYVEKLFPAEAKEKAQKMIQNVILAYKNRINSLTWMSPETKVKAVEKLNKITIKIGYPDKWKDYSALTIKSTAEGGTYFDNSKNLSKWAFKKSIDKLSKPVDKTEWGMSPQTVNAYYNPSYNEIVFPAAILQPPFYNYQADEAVNYGGIGAVIGHEISHGFDDSGARYNAEGNLVDWWTDEDLKQFTALGTDLANQYSALEPLPGVHVDGHFTLGENIGDLGGINAAYDGLQLYLKENGNPGLIDGFTPEQRFFISWATVWRTKTRDEAIKNQVKTDPHSPGMYRAYVPIQNVDAFYKAFDIKKGDKMYVEPEKRVKIW